jgi:hypothetical protein
MIADLDGENLAHAQIFQRASFVTPAQILDLFEAAEHSAIGVKDGGSVGLPAQCLRPCD